MCLFSALAIALMVFMTVVDIISRKFFMAPRPGTYEYITLLFVAVIFLSLPSVEKSEGNIYFDLFYNRLSPNNKLRVGFFVIVTSLLFFAMITWQSFIGAMVALDRGDTIMGAIPVLTWPSRLMVPIGSGFVFLRLITKLVQLLRGIGVVGQMGLVKQSEKLKSKVDMR